MNTDDSNAVSNPDVQTSRRPAITTAFSGYDPPSNLVPIIRRMLDSVPEKYLTGLVEVVLTNAGNMPRSRRRSVTKSRGRKMRVREVRGLYHPAFHGRQAWIEIFVDNTLRWWNTRLRRLFPFARDIELSNVLFHEIGHHIHYTARPEFREKEDVADIWKARLMRNYSRQRHRWLGWIIRNLHVGGLLRRASQKADAMLFSKGYISRAEYEESVSLTNSRDRTSRL